MRRILAGNGIPSFQAFALDGRPPVTSGPFSPLRWSLDGRSLFTAGAWTYSVPLRPGEALPPIPAGGFHSAEEIAHLPGARKINADNIVPGPSADVYAFYRTTIQRNLYRIPIQ